MSARVSPFLGNLYGDQLEIKHAHLFCGLGGFAAGYNMANPRLGNLGARFRCLGGIDVDPAAIKDFERLVGVKGTMLDMFSREQYIAFHGKEPPREWREATPEDIRSAFGNESPDVVALSAPCKGFSGLLAEDKSKSAKYQALNQLAMCGVWLTLEAFKDDLPAIWTFENVPRIQSRGRHMLDQITALLKHYGYVVAETTHDCGELGNLGQSRKRFLMVARLVEKVPNFLYEPEKHSLRSVGDVIGRFPMPGDVARAGAMHRIPALQWKTWVRLAFVPPGKDWRALNELAVVNGVLRDFGLVPESAHERGPFGVTPWEDHADSVRGRSLPTNGRFSVADPRDVLHPKSVAWGVRAWDEPGAAVTTKMVAGGGPNSIADPRYQEGPNGPHFNNCFRVVRFSEPSPTISAGGSPSAGGLCVADPRKADMRGGKYRITRIDEPAGAVIAGSTTGQSAFAVADPHLNWSPDAHRNKLKMTPFDAPAGTVIGAQGVQNGAQLVADPRPNIERNKGDAYLHSRLFGVVPWNQPSFVVSAKAKHDNGPNNVADPRLPAPADKLVCYIRSLDGTWHRPFTTLELAALQDLVDPEEHLELEGLSDSAWRERIGNAVPRGTAKAIANEIGRCLLMAHAGETFTLGSTPIWVRNVAIALSVAPAEAMS